MFLNAQRIGHTGDNAAWRVANTQSLREAGLMQRLCDKPRWIRKVKYISVWRILLHLLHVLQQRPYGSCRHKETASARGFLPDHAVIERNLFVRCSALIAADAKRGHDRLRVHQSVSCVLCCKYLKLGVSPSHRMLGQLCNDFKLGSVNVV